MLRITRLLAAAAALPIILTSCSKEQASNNDQIGSSGRNSIRERSAPSPNIQTVEQLVTSLDQFQKRPTLVPRDDEHLWRALASMEGSSIFGSIEVGCGGGHDRVESVNPSMLNFNGHLISPDLSDTSEAVAFWLLNDLGFYDRRSRAIRSRFGTQVFHCHVFSEGMNRWMQSHPELLDQSSSPAGITYARRINPVFEFENEYRTELPLKGQVPIVSLRFSYELRPLLPGLSAQGRGSGAAKAYLDSDSGQWTFMEFRLQDPDLRFTAQTRAGSPTSVTSAREPAGAGVQPQEPQMADFRNTPTTEETLPSDYTNRPRCPAVYSEVSFRRWLRNSRQPIDPVKNRVLVRSGNGSYAWNGTAVNGITLHQYLELTETMNPRPVLVVSIAAGVNEAEKRLAAYTVAGALGCRPNREVFGF